MPIVPIQQSLAPTDVTAPSVDTRLAGSAEEALNTLGNQMTEVGLNLQKKIRTIEAEDASFQTKHDDYLWAAEMENKFKYDPKYRDGYVRDDAGNLVKDPESGKYKTTTQLFSEMADQRFKANQEKMPTYLAQQVYKQEQNQWFVNKVMQVQTDEQAARYTYNKQSISDGFQKMADGFIAAPPFKNGRADLSEWYLQNDNGGKRIGAGVGVDYSYNVAFDMGREEMSKTAEAVMDGYVHKIHEKQRLNKIDLQEGKPVAIYDPRQDALDGLSMLDGKDPVSTRRPDGTYKLADVLTPAQQDRLRGQFGAILNIKDERDKEESRKDFNLYLKNMLAKQRNGKGALNTDLADVWKNFDRMISIGKATPTERAFYIQDMVVEREVNKINTPAWAGMSLEAKLKSIGDSKLKNGAIGRLIFQRDALPADSPYKSVLGEEAEMKLRDRITDLANQQEAKRIADSARYAIDSQRSDGRAYAPLASYENALVNRMNDPKVLVDPRLHGLMKNVVAAGNGGNGRAEVNILPDNLATQITTMLRDPRVNAAEKAQNLTQFARTQPKYYKYFMDQMVRKKLLTPEWELVSKIYAHEGGETLASTFIDLISEGAQQTHEAYKTRLGDQYAEWRNTVLSDENFKKFNSAMMADVQGLSNRAMIVNSYNDLFLRRAAIIKSAPGNDGMGEKEVAKAAYDSLVGQYTYVFKTSRNDGEPFYIRIDKRLPDGNVVLQTDEKLFVQLFKSLTSVDNLKKMSPDQPRNWPFKTEDLYKTIFRTAYLKPDPENPENFLVAYIGHDKTEQRLTKNGKTLSYPIVEILKRRGEYDPNPFEQVMKYMGWGDYPTSKQAEQINRSPQSVMEDDGQIGDTYPAIDPNEEIQRDGYVPPKTRQVVKETADMIRIETQDEQGNLVGASTMKKSKPKPKKKK